MNVESLVQMWFDKWKSGEYRDLPISDNFRHTSPFGTINGKEAYLELVRKNQEKFLGYEFIIQDALYDKGKGCVRYTAKQGGDFTLEVSEWYYVKDNLIDEIIAYYHIGEIREERRMNE